MALAMLVPVRAGQLLVGVWGAVLLLSKAEKPGQPVGVAHQNLDDSDTASPRHPATPTA
jgi:hypothetical protein